MHCPEIMEKYKQHGQRVYSLMKEHKTKFNWRTGGHVSLLDIGCASSGVTMEFILPIFPPNFDQLIGVDLFEDMIVYAQKTHSKPNFTFKVFNIETGDTRTLPQVDHITMIYLCVPFGFRP